MLDLKAKLLAAGVVTADQVKKVEDEQAERRAREKERREAQRRRREEGPPAGDEGRGDRPRGDRSSARGDRPRGDRRDRPRADRPPRELRPDQAAVVDGAEGAAVEATGTGGAPRRTGRPRDTRSFKERRAEENLEKRARREQEWTESLRWRDRLDALQAAGKSEQYAAIRGWVMKERLDNTQITEAARRFYFTTSAGTVSHLTVEPDVHDQLVDGTAGIVAFIGYNGQEHAVVPKDVAFDIRVIKPEWLRHLIGVTDLEPPLVKPPSREKADGDAADNTGEAEAAGSDDGEGAAASDDGAIDAGGEADDGAVTAAPPGAEPDVT
jgi:uncharacterized protein YaiL (DUF2058 family)